MTPQEASARALTMLDEGRILRGAWRGPPVDGRERLCAYLALRGGDGPDSTAACPTWLCPQWVAHLIVFADDKTSAEQWPALMARLFSQVARWGELTPAAWERVNAELRVACIDEALRRVTVDEWGVRAACVRVVAALRGEGDLAEAAEAAEEAAWTAGAAAWTARTAAKEAAADRLVARFLDLVDQELP